MLMSQPILDASMTSNDFADPNLNPTVRTPQGPIRGPAVFSGGTGLVSIDTARS